MLAAKRAIVFDARECGGKISRQTSRAITREDTQTHMHFRFSAVASVGSTLVCVRWVDTVVPLAHPTTSWFDNGLCQVSRHCWMLLSLAHLFAFAEVRAATTLATNSRGCTATSSQPIASRCVHVL